MTVFNELLDELLKGSMRPEDLLGGAGLMKELKVRLMERILGTGWTAHLGYEEDKGAPAGHLPQWQDTRGWDHVRLSSPTSARLRSIARRPAQGSLGGGSLNRMVLSQLHEKPL